MATNHVSSEAQTIAEAAMSAKAYRVVKTRKGKQSQRKDEGSRKKKQHEPNLGQKEAREEKEKSSKLAHMGEMSDKS
jgi:hypothetical protein